MDTWEQFKFIWDLNDRQLANRRREFLRNYKVSVPIISLYSILMGILGYLMIFVGPDMIFSAKEGVNNYLVPYQSNLVFIGLLVLFMSFYASLFISIFSKSFRIADKALIFPSPILRKNLVRAGYLRSSYWMFGSGALILIPFYLITIPFVGFSTRPITIMFVILIIAHSFSNVNLLLSHASIKFNNNKYWQLIEGSITTIVIVALTIPGILFFIMCLNQKIELEPFIALFLTEPYNLLMTIPYIGGILIIGHNPLHLDVIFWGTLIFLDVITTFVLWNTNYFVWEDDHSILKQVEPRPLGEIRYDNRELHPPPSWWRKGPFKDLHWELPNTDLGSEALIAKNILISRRVGFALFMRIVFLVLAISIFVIFIRAESRFYFYPFPIVWTMILMTSGVFMLTSYMPITEGRRFEMMKIMPFSGKEIILTFIKPQIKVTLIPYFNLSLLALIFSGNFTLYNILLIIFLGPSLLLGLLSYLYYLYYATIHRLEMDKTQVDAHPIFLFGAFSLFFIYMIVYLGLAITHNIDKNLNLILITGAIHCLMALIFLPASFKAVERSEVKA